MASEMHPRARLVNKARSELSAAIGKWLKANDLTTAEEIMLLVSVSNDLVIDTMRNVIKEQRVEGNDASSGFPP